MSQRLQGAEGMQRPARGWGQSRASRPRGHGPLPTRGSVPQGLPPAPLLASLLLSPCLASDLLIILSLTTQRPRLCPFTHPKGTKFLSDT